MPLPSAAEADRIAKILVGIRKSGLKAREQFDKTGDEVWKYAYDPTFTFLYQDWENNNGELFFKAKIAAAAQYIEVMGPYLYQYNPTYEIQPEHDQAEQQQMPPSWSDRRYAVEKRYLSWSAKRGDQYGHSRRAVDEAVTRGRGILWTGYNARRKCVQHVYGPAKELIDDPDARNTEERNLIMRDRLKPRWELANLYPARRAVIWGLPKAGNLPTGMSQQSSGGKATEIVRYTEAYLRIGIGNYGSGTGTDDADGAPVQDAPLKYIFADDELLDVLPWEIPFWRDDLWPCSTLDLQRIPNSIYPAPPLEAGLGLLRALNWSHTLILSQLQIATRLSFVVMNINGQKMDISQLLKIIRGEHYDIAVLDQVGNEYTNINQVIQQLKIETSLPLLRELNDMLSLEFQKSTGLYDLLFAGQTQTQLRTAEDVKLKDRNSRSRIEDRSESVRKWATECGRKSRFAARYLEGPDDISQLFGPEAGEVWGDLASPEEVAANHQKRTQVFQMAYQQIGQFEQQQYLQAQAQFQRVAAQAGEQAGSAMAAGMQAPPPPQPPPPPSAEQIEQQAVAVTDQQAPDNLVDFDQWMLEADVSIESGSMRRKDITQEIDVYTEASNQLMPTMLQSPNPKVQGIALKIAARKFEVAGAPEELVNQITEAAGLVENTPPMMPGAK